MDRNSPESVQRLEQLVTEDGFEGLRMHLSRTDDPAEWAASSQNPIWRKAEELGACCGGTDLPHIFSDIGYGRGLALFRDHMAFLNEEDKRWLFADTAKSIWKFGTKLR